MLLRWGVCGAGAISADFSNCLKLLDSAEHQVAGVAASSLQRAQAFIEEHALDEAKAYGSYDHLFKCPDVDIVYVGLLNHMHEYAVISALENGKHVLCEKPLGLNLNQVERMIDCAAQNNRFLMEAYWTKFFPAWTEAKKLIADGAIGKAQLFMADSSAIRLKPNKMERELGGGAMMAIGCYLPMLALDVFGTSPSSVQVFGYKRLNGMRFNAVDDTASVMLRFPGEQIAQLTYSSSAATPRTASVGGTKGYIQLSDTVWCPTKLTLSTTADGKKFEKETREFAPPECKNRVFRHPQNPTGLCYEAMHVRECIMKGLTESPVMGWEESRRVIKVLDEIRRQLGVKYPKE